MTTKPTRRQRAVLNELSFRDSLTPRQLGVSSDVLWRMNERGWVSATLSGRYSLTRAGREIVDAR